MNKITILKELGPERGIEFQAEGNEDSFFSLLDSPIEFLDSYGILDDEDYYSVQTDFLGGNERDIYDVARVSLFNELQEKISSWLIIQHQPNSNNYIPLLEFYGQIYVIILQYEKSKEKLTF